MNTARAAESLGRILLAEDEPEVCAFLTDELAGAGYDVACAANDQAAYELLEREWRSFSALILDVNLGRGTTGFDVARFGRGLNARMPVIFTTGFNAENSIQRYGVPGAVFVAKPFSGSDMLTAVQKLTGAAAA